MSKTIYIYGASGHGLVVADIALSCGYDDIIFLDDGDNEYPCFKDIKRKDNFPLAFGIGDNTIREKLFNLVQKSGVEIVSLLHPSAIISSSAKIGIGTVVMPSVVVNAKCSLGKGVILNTSCVIEHECTIGDFVHISPNAALAGGVSIGNLTHIGIGSNILQGIKIGKNSIIGGGSMVIKDIKNNKKVVGVPAREITKKR